MKTTSTEVERAAWQAQRNRQDLRDYYRKRAALSALTGTPFRVPAKHAHLVSNRMRESA